MIICVDDQGNLVYYDYGMMDELKPSVRKKARGACLLGMRGIFEAFFAGLAFAPPIC